MCPPSRRRARRQLDADVLADVKLLVSERITNSIKYGGKGEVVLNVEAPDAQQVRVEVVDQGVGFVPVARNRRRPRSAGGASIWCRRSPTAGASMRARRTCVSRSTAKARSTAGRPRSDVAPTALSPGARRA